MALVISEYLMMLGRLSCFMTHSFLIARLLFCLYSSFGIQFCGLLLQLRAVFLCFSLIGHCYRIFRFFPYFVDILFIQVPSSF